MDISYDKKKIMSVLTVFLILSNFFIFSSNMSANEIKFSSETSNYDSIIKLAFVGDIIMIEEVQLTAQRLMNDSITDPYQKVASGFEELFSDEIKHALSSADICFGNLESPIAEGLTENWYYNENGRPISEEIEVDPGILYDGVAYKYNPFFIMNAHPALALALKNVGFDIVSTANNHFSNRASNGVDKTIDALEKADLDYVGTMKYSDIFDDNNDGFPDNKAYVIKEVDGVKIAFLAFVNNINYINGGFHWRTVVNNGLLTADKFCSRQVYCPLSNNSPIDFNVNNFCRWITKAKQESDIVAVSLHAGIWQHHFPSALQKKYVNQFINSGADIIIGSGPHVLQPIEIREKEDEKACIFYSLGNFVHKGGSEGWGLTNSYSSIIGYVNIVKKNFEIKIRNYSYEPTFSLKKPDGNTEIVLANETFFSESYDIINTVLTGNTLELYLLSKKYIRRIPGLNILILDDVLIDNWINLKWALNQI